MSLGRRELLQVATATAALAAANRALAQGKSLTQDDLLRFTPVGQLTILNFTDLHAQLVPLYFREPSVNIGVGAAAGLPPHLTRCASAGPLRSPPARRKPMPSAPRTIWRWPENTAASAASIAWRPWIMAIRAERPNVLLLDGGDGWQGSSTALMERGADMVRVQNALAIDAMTAHWEFTHGAALGGRPWRRRFKRRSSAAM